MISCSLVILFSMGGSISEYRKIVDSGCSPRIEGKCASACTMFLRTGCVTKDALLGFHRAKVSNGNTIAEDYYSRVMSSYYPVAIQSWYNKGPINSHDVVWIKGSEAIRLGAKECK